MMNETKNKREWVKNAAIIFLTVMLLLTFFSNTILNWSLPEVSGQYAGYGQIMTAVTGSGTVTALQNYKIVLDQPRTIESVLVREGDTVEAGQTLFVLEEYENEELKAAEKELDNMKYNYQVKLLNKEDGVYDKNLNDISELEEKLIELKADRETAQKHEQLLKASEEKVKIYQNEADKYNQLKTELDEEYALLTSGESENSKEIAEKTAELELAEKEYEAAKETLDLRKEQYDEIYEDIEIPYSTAKAAYDNAYDAYTSASTELTYLQQDYNALVSSDSEYSAAKKNYDNAKKSLDEIKTHLDNAKSEYESAREYYNTVKDDSDKCESALKAMNDAKAVVDELQKDYDEQSQKTDERKAKLDALNAVSSSELTSAKRMLEKQKDTVDELKRALSKASTELNAARSDENDLEDARELLKNAEDSEKNAKKKVEELQKQLDSLLTTEMKAVKEEIKQTKATLKAIEEKLSQENKKLDELRESDIAATKQLDTQIKETEKAIETAKKEAEDLNEKQEKDDLLFDLDISRDLKAMKEQEEKIEKLKEKTYTNEVVSKNAGVVAALNVYAGLETSAGDILAEIELSGSGYVIEIPVTLEQSRKIKVGDKVSVTNYYWGEKIDMSVSEIKADRTNPNGNRIVVIAVEGDVENGRKFDISIGESKASYDTVVPNRAIREDASGKYILVASVKSTPLGNRYIAKRIDVTVVDKDNINSAVDTGSEYNYEFVITSSTAPIEDGSQVRLVDN